MGKQNENLKLNKFNENKLGKNLTQLNRKEMRSERGRNYNNRSKKRMTDEMILEKLNYSFTRDAEWFKRTYDKVGKVKEDLDNKFYTEEKKAQKIDFIRKLKTKLKDYKDALNNEQKYKGIRFFERRKLERMLKKVNKEIDSLKNSQSDIDESKIKELEEKKENIIKDINYVKFYPKTYKYYSLFPNKDKDNPETLKKVEKMRRKIHFFLNKKNKGKIEDSSDDEEEEIDEGKENEIDKEVDNDNLHVDHKVEELEDIANQNKIKLKTKTKKQTKKDFADYEKEANKIFNKTKSQSIKDDNFFILEDE